MVKRVPLAPRPLDEENLRALALAYVARYATSSGKLTLYLRRKVRERGWAADTEAPIEAIVKRCTDSGFVDDGAYAESRARGLRRKGLGERLIRQNLQEAGVETGLATYWAQADGEDPILSALRLAKRKRIGPYAAQPVDDRMRQRWIGQFVRAGHAIGIVQQLLKMKDDEAEQHFQREMS